MYSEISLDILLVHHNNCSLGHNFGPPSEGWSNYLNDENKSRYVMGSVRISFFIGFRVDIDRVSNHVI
jgi:hypothetical protein